MKYCILSSGSKGNSTYLNIENKHILIDVGNSCLYVEQNLKSIGVDPKDIDIVLITHSHVDHVLGLKSFCKKYQPEVYIDTTTYQEIKCELQNVKFIESKIDLGTIIITPFKLSHDVTAHGYLIESKKHSFVYVTDTGYLKEKTLSIIKNKEVYVFESNHDIEKLMNNTKYPHHVKIRILGDSGHLSNKDSSYYLTKLIGEKTKQVFLAHLSQDNNLPSLALETLKTELKNRNIEFNNIECAKQNEKTELLEV